MKKEKILYEEDRKKILRDMMETNSTVRGSFLIIICKILLVIIILLLIRGIFGKIEIKNNLGMYPASKNRYFLATINNKPVNVNVELRFNFPVIPFLLYIQNHLEYVSTYGNDYYEYQNYNLKEDDKKIIINVKSYECYYKGNRHTCKDYNYTSKKEKKINIKNMIINIYGEENKEIYNGKYIKDITKYVNKKGIYEINLSGTYNLTDFDIYFELNNDFNINEELLDY